MQLWRILLAIVLFCGMPASSVRADFLFITPLGNPTVNGAGSSVTSGQYTVSLNSDIFYPPARSVIYPTDGFRGPPVTFNPYLGPEDTLGPSLLAILDTQHFGPADGWTILRFDLQGSISLDYYSAWANAIPVFTTSGGRTYPGKTVTGSGGAAIGLHYYPSGTDPVETAHWLQIVWTNSISVVRGVQLSGYYYFLDVAIDASSPYYDLTDTEYANQTDFLDAPARPFDPNTQWYAATFIAFGSTPLKTLFISNQAILWGFVDPIASVPEPSTFALSLAGIACWIARGLHCRLQRRIIQGRPAS